MQLPILLTSPRSLRHGFVDVLMAHRPWKIVGLQLSGARTGKFHSVFFPLSVSLGSNPQEGFWVLGKVDPG